MSSPDLIIVHAFPWYSERLSSVSPFVLKLETWLRLAGLPSKTVGDFNPYTAPKGKAPWVTLEDGTQLSDSSLIIAALAERPSVTLDDHLTPADRAQHLLVQRVVEDHLYWCVICERWREPDGFAITRREYFKRFPRLLVPFLAFKARRTAVSQAWQQGLGRHAIADVYAAGVADIEALGLVLGDRPFFGGERPSSIDATVYGSLANIAWGPFSGPLQAAALGQPAIAAWLDRVYDLAWAPKG